MQVFIAAQRNCPDCTGRSDPVGRGLGEARSGLDSLVQSWNEELPES